MTNYKENGNNIELIQPDFDLDETLDCGQAFRWEKLESDYKCTYTGFFLDKPLTISHDGEKFIFHNTTKEEIILILKKTTAKSKPDYHQMKL